MVSKDVCEDFCLRDARTCDPPQCGSLSEYPMWVGVPLTSDLADIALPGKQHRRIKRFLGNSENAVKT
jgi:hypothetical protein